MKRILIIFQGVCLLLLMAVQPVVMASAPVADQARLLSDSQRQALTTKIQQVEAKYNVKIGICTLQNLPDGKVAGKFANDILDKNYAGSVNGSIVLLVVMGSRDWYISTDNNMRIRIPDGTGIKGLQNYFLSDLSDGDYDASFNAFVDGIDDYLDYYEAVGEPYDPAEEFDWLAAVIALAVAAVGGAGFAYYLICGMSNVVPAREADAYLQHDSVDIQQRQDRFLYTTVTRHKKAKDRDSGSSTSSSDSSHGGGGGKF
ncbi:MAG: TPM domain-containing protein [Selenomonas sp.]|uniref:TPM domain-containing protein n=1 Tax=Selenomonas sp. TaxID=2053611 RepID=UPI0025F6DDD4|nr:TPM domain-containing protein [Selenomonas sp.]MCR5757051.1 TPM domain-containing protein [Selenomonas sp.]